MSDQLSVAVICSVPASRLPSKTQSGRSVPERQWVTASIGLFTVASTCRPTSCTATSPPPRKGT